MTLSDALAILDGNSRVLCPQITCEEARGIAEVIREQRMVNWDLDAGQNMMEEHIAKVEKERDEARAEVERLRAVPVCHCLVCVHAREGDVEVDASDYEKPRKK